MDSDLVSTMLERARRWENAQDRRSIFLNCYAMMTQSMSVALAENRFRDGVWVDRWVGHFAGYYFNALDAYEKGQEQTPAVWRHAHDAAQRPQTLTLQNLLLGINAHINYDLVLVLAELLEAEEPPKQPLRYEDHCTVNQIIARTVDRVQDQVLEPYAPALGIIDRLMGPLDEWLMSHLIAHWRDDVWQAALEMAAAPDGATREKLRLQTEAKSMERARCILICRS